MIAVAPPADCQLKKDGAKKGKRKNERKKEGENKRERGREKRRASDGRSCGRQNCQEKSWGKCVRFVGMRLGRKKEKKNAWTVTKFKTIFLPFLTNSHEK